MALEWLTKPEGELENIQRDERRVLPGAKGTPSAETSPDAELLVVGKGEPGEGGLETLIGRDDRTRVLQTESPPWRMICSLSIEGEFGRLRGTGWLAGPRTVVTAGHCVYDTEQLGGWARSIQISAGRNDDQLPFSSLTSTRLAALSNWVQGESSDFDIGAIQLDQPLGEEVGWFSTAALTDAELESFRVNISGYPASPGQGKQQWFHENRILSVRPLRIFYDVDTVGGQSGSPVWIYESPESEPLVIGIHTAGVGPQAFRLGIVANSAPRITHDVLEVIQAWTELDNWGVTA